MKGYLNKFQNTPKKERGITLIALVITIVILIILATVAINAVFKDGGLIDQAEKAKDLYNNSAKDEETAMSNLAQQLNELWSEEGGSGPEEPTPPTVEEKLKAGDYVTYPSPSGDIACRVLYDSSSGYGVQLITSDTVTDSYILGTSGDFDGNKTLYNKVINTLNSAVSSYNNSTYSTVRCVGSVRNNPSQDSEGYHTTQFGSDYDGQFKDTDTNYETDYNQMETLGIRNIGKSYWLASRNVNSTSEESNFHVRGVGSSGSLGNATLCRVYSSGRTGAFSSSNGLRPVFTLKSDIKVTGGNGESGTPYTLGV